MGDALIAASSIHDRGIVPPIDLTPSDSDDGDGINWLSVSPENYLDGWPQSSHRGL